jgi:peptidoglycan/LPS O-acetylase OafA/YrhL
MRPFALFRIFSTFLLFCALTGIAVMLASDGYHRFVPSSAHQHVGAFPLILIGLSYICMQPTVKRPRSEWVKGVLLGLAFVLWGSEQLLPATQLTTVMDEAVVGIFVVDLGLIILEHLKRNDHELP